MGCWGLEKVRRIFFIIIKDSNHATNFEPCVIRYLQRHPEINTLVSQASQVEEKCFRSKRPNFASKNAFSPSAALRAAACKARVALGRVRQEKSQNKSPEATPRGFCFEVTGQNYNSQFFTIYSLNYTFFNIDFRNNIFIILATNTKYYFGFVDILYKMINRN